jgi:hypothetical protein
MQADGKTDQAKLGRKWRDPDLQIKQTTVMASVVLPVQ